MATIYSKDIPNQLANGDFGMVRLIRDTAFIKPYESFDGKVVIIPKGTELMLIQGDDSVVILDGDYENHTRPTCEFICIDFDQYKEEEVLSDDIEKIGDNRRHLLATYCLDDDLRAKLEDLVYQIDYFYEVV